jgi:hypothetical protein
MFPVQHSLFQAGVDYGLYSSRGTSLHAVRRAYQRAPVGLLKSERSSVSQYMQEEDFQLLL